MKTTKKGREKSKTSKCGGNAKHKVDRFVCHSHESHVSTPSEPVPEPDYQQLMVSKQSGIIFWGSLDIHPVINLRIQAYLSAIIRGLKEHGAGGLGGEDPTLSIEERIRKAKEKIAERKLLLMCLFVAMLLLWLLKLKVLWRDSDVLHRPCFVYLLLVRACIERNPGPDTIRDRVFEIELNDPTILEQMRSMRTKTLNDILSFMEGYIRIQNMACTTLFLYVRSVNGNELRFYMILTLSSWPEMNSFRSEYCTKQSQFLAYRDQSYVKVCLKSGNTNGFDYLNRFIKKIGDIDRIPFTQRFDEHLYRQFCNGCRVQTVYIYDKPLFDTGNPKTSEAAQIANADDDVLLVKHFLFPHECTYTTPFGYIRCLDSCLKLIVTNTQVTQAMVETLAQSDPMLKDVVESNSEMIIGDMGFEMEQLHVAVLSLANTGCHKPEIDEIVSELQCIAERGGLDACRSNLI